MKKNSRAPRYISFDEKAQLAFVTSFRDKKKIQKKRANKRIVSSISDSKRKRMSDLRVLAKQIEQEEASFAKED